MIRQVLLLRWQCSLQTLLSFEHSVVGHLSTKVKRGKMKTVGRKGDELCVAFCL